MGQWWTVVGKCWENYALACSSNLTNYDGLVIFAFPMMLAGTVATALVAYFIFPYGWSFDLCLTFGSILAATDPVAVAVLLNQLGAPARLKVGDYLNVR